MKKLCVLALFSLSTAAFAQDDMKIKQGSSSQDSSYCLVLKDGMTLLTTTAGKEIHTDITLENGTKITPSGNVVKKDGTQTMLKEGECVSSTGETVIGSATRKNNTNGKKENKRMGPNK